MPIVAEIKELLLANPRWKISAAESLTAGHLQARLTSISGSSDYFEGGLTAYSLGQKVRKLRVNEATAVASNCVSRAVAEQMARGACEFFQTEIGVATTGYAEPSVANGITVPSAWWAIAHVRGLEYVLRAGRVEFPNTARVDVQQRVAEAVLRELAAYLREARGQK